ncbi:hypothetical protein VTL71DRAFT_16527 [Oculimacula yallundae]|uniref:ZZ-type domain-containing protein n=1 Tax=Oculimacula yallundae TaxID=86028 RepID=A0ABR4CEN8_9HELO
MAPLGIITAIVGAIRVGGPPWLKAVIGRARENRSSAELDFMSSTSHEGAQSRDDRPDRAPNISLNLHSKQATWELVATAAAGILLQSGVLVFSAFVAYHTRFGSRIGGPPSPYAFPVLLAGTITLALGMWISALVIGESTEEFEWEIMFKDHAENADKSEKGHSAPNPKRTAVVAKPAHSVKTKKATFRVFWLQQGIFVSDQSFDSFMLMARGKKEIILTSVRNNDPITPEEARKTGRTEGSTDTSLSLNILCIIGTFASITGFILQFEGFRGISWACSIAQLVAIIIMTVLRAAVRRGMLDSPATERIIPKYEMDWLSLKLGFDGGYINSFSDPPKKPCTKCGKRSHKPVPCTALEVPFWKVCNKLGVPSRAALSESPKRSDDEKSGSRVTWEKSIAGSPTPLRPGYPLPTDSSGSSAKSQERPNAEVKEDEAKEQLKNDSLRVHAVVNIRKRLGDLTRWEVPLSEHAAGIAKAIGSVMNLFDLGELKTFFCYVDVQSVHTSSGRNPGKLKLVAGNNGTRLEPLWTTPKEDIEAILSLWMYHFADEKQWRPEKGGEMPTRLSFERPNPTRTPFRRVLGPDSKILKADLAWWAGEGVADGLSTFTWDKSDNPLSLGYGFQKDKKARENGIPPTCCAMVTNISMERFLAQHLFSAFMWEIAEKLPALESPTTIDLQSQSKFNPQLPRWRSLRLVNQKMQDMAKAVEANPLGTLEDAYTLIIPPLSLAEKLPSEALVEMVRRKAVENHEDYQLDKAYDLYLQLLFECDNLLLNKKFVYKAIATAIDFLITTNSVRLTDEGAAGDSDPQLKIAKAALIKKLKSENLKEFSIRLKELFKKQKRLSDYTSILSWKDEEAAPPESSKKTAIKDTRSAQTVGAEFGYTTLHNNIISMKSNIDKDSDCWKFLEASDILGWTPLHYAVIYAPGIASILLQKNRLLASRSDLAGRIPLHYAVMDYRDDGRKLTSTNVNNVPNNLDLVDQLLKAYGRADSGCDGILPLHLASEFGNEKIVTVLLGSPLHKDKMSDGDHWGMTPLHFAASEGKDAIVQLLLDREAKVNAHDNLDRTALHLAVQNIRPMVVKKLLDRDDTKVYKIRDKNDKTALRLVSEMQRDVGDKLAKTKADLISVENKLKKESSSQKNTDDNIPTGGKMDEKSAEAAGINGVVVLGISKTGTGIIDGTEKAQNDDKTVKEMAADEEVTKGQQLKIAPKKAGRTDERKNRQLLSKDKKALQTRIHGLSTESESLQEILTYVLDKEDLAVDGGKLLLWTAEDRLDTTFKLLMEKGVEADERNPSTGRSALHFAAMVGSEGMAQLLLDKWTPREVGIADTVRKVDDPATSTNSTRTTKMVPAEMSSVLIGGLLKTEMVNAIDNTGTTALILAAVGGFSKIVDVLLEAGANQMIADQEKRLALSWAVEKGQVAIVKRLLDSDDTFCMNPNAPDGEQPRFLLARAAENGNLAMAKLLHGKGAKLNLGSDSDHSPIHWAVIKGHEDLVAYFLETTPIPDVDEYDKQTEYTLLSQAIIADRLNITKRLLEAGADVKKTGGLYKQTPLSFAATLNRPLFVTLLLDHHFADTEEVDSDGWTPLLFAVNGNHLETAKILIAKGAHASFSRDREHSDLSLAVRIDSDEMVRTVLTNPLGERLEEHLDNAVLWAAKKGNDEVLEVLLDKKANPNALSKNGSTPLLKAAKRGNLATIQLLLKWKADINLANEKGETPLYRSSNNGFEAVAEELLRKHADLNIPIKSGSTPLLAAIKQANGHLAEILLDAGAEVNVKNDLNETPLYWACAEGSAVIVKRLLDNGAEPNVITKHHSTPLLKAIESENTAAVDLLLQNKDKAKFEVTDSNVYSALNLASWMGNKEVVKMLLALGADLMVLDQDGDTPLHQAAYSGHLDVVSILLNAGANPEARNKVGKSPLHYAAGNGHVDIMELLLSKNVQLDHGDCEGRTPLSLASANGHDNAIRLLSDHTADVDSKDNIGRSPISWAASENKESTVVLLHTLKANIESVDRNDRTALSWAASQESIAAANQLLLLYADVECKDKDGRTALSWAASGGQDEMAKRLLEAKAHVISFDNDGRSPLSWAVSARNEEVVTLLLQQDPDIQIEAEEKAKNGGCTVLHRAVETGDTSILELILNAEPNVDKPDEKQETPLGLAARNINKRVIIQLLEANANPNVQDNSGRTPLFSAIHLDHDSAVLEMLDRDLDTEKHPPFSRTPLQEAMFQYSYDVVDKLLTRGADVGGKDIQEIDAIHVAASRSSCVYLKLLVDKGLDRHANIPIKYDLQGRHALHHAACSREPAVVSFLLDKYKKAAKIEDSKSPVDEKGIEGWNSKFCSDGDGWTPLHWAAKAGAASVVKIFLEHGADATSREKLNNWTPKQVAQFHVQESVVEALDEYFEEHGIVSDDDVVAPGVVDDSRMCDGCFITPICGIVYCCTTCVEFDFCYKCKHTADNTHPGHAFEERKPEIEEE